MTVKLLNALTEIYEFYQFVHTDKHLLTALHCLVYGDDKRYKLTSEGFTAQEWQEIQDLNARAPKIPEACDTAIGVLISDTKLPLDFKRKELIKACEELREAWQNHYKSHKTLLEEAIRMLRRFNANQKDAAEAAGAKPAATLTPAVPAGAPSVTSPPAIPPIDKDKENIIMRLRPSIKNWRVTYKGVTQVIKNCTGMFYLATLMLHKKQPIAALKLVRLANKADKDELDAPVFGSDKLSDKEAKNNYDNEFKEYDEEIDKAKRHEGEGLVRILQEEMGDQIVQMKKDEGLHGRSRRFPTDPDLAQESVYKAIERGAKEKLKEAFAGTDIIHSTIRHIKITPEFIYTPTDDAADWFINM